MSAKVADTHNNTFPSIDEANTEPFPEYDMYGTKWADLPKEVVISRVQACFNIMYAHYLMYKEELRSTVPDHEYNRIVNWFEKMAKEGADSEEYKIICSKITGQKF